MKKIIEWWRHTREHGREIKISYSPMTVFMVVGVAVGILLQAGLMWLIGAIACVLGLLVCLVYVTGGHIQGGVDDD
jgi:hypothetical protein